MAAQPKEHIITTLLSRAHSPTTTSSIFRDKVQKQPLLLKPSERDPKVDAREARRRARQQKAKTTKSNKPRPLSAKQKRALCIYDIPESQRKYAIYEPLNRMWCGYIREVLGLDRVAHVTPTGAGPMLTSADFHGAMVEVVRSRCVGRVGIGGIVVKDTKFTFEIITKANEIKSEFATSFILLDVLLTDEKLYRRNTQFSDSVCRLLVRSRQRRRGRWYSSCMVNSSRLELRIARTRSSEHILTRTCDRSTGEQAQARKQRRSAWT